METLKEQLLDKLNVEQYLPFLGELVVNVTYEFISGEENMINNFFSHECSDSNDVELNEIWLEQPNGDIVNLSLTNEQKLKVEQYILDNYHS